MTDTFRYLPVQCEREGQRFNGSWYEAGGFIHFASAYGAKSAQVKKGQEPEAVVERLFSDVCETRCKG